MDQQEIDLRQIVQVLRRRLALLLLMPVIAGLVAGLLSVFVMAPVFSAKTTLWVIKDDTTQLSYNDVLLSRNLTKTYAEIAKSDAVMADVISKLRLTQTVAQLQSQVSVTPVRDTEIIAFTVEDTSAIQAAAIANELAAAFQNRIRSFMKVENVAVVDRATAPISPIKPRSLMNVAVAIVLGGMAAVGIVFLMEYLDTTLKSPEDVAQHLGLPVLGTIPVIEIAVPGEAPMTMPSPARSRRKKRKGVFQS